MTQDRRASLVLGAAALLAAGLLSGAPAQAQTQPPPLNVSINARAYAALIPGSAITVEIDNDTDQAQRLKADIVAALVAHGYRVQPGAPLVLAFYATEPNGTGDGGTLARRIDGFQASPVGPGGGTIGNFHVNDQHLRTGLFSTVTDSLFGHKPKPQVDQEVPDGRAIHLSMDLNERAGPRRVWEGSAGTTTERGDSYEVTSEIVPALIERLGYNSVEQISLP
jgi:hypothetical protein